MNPPLDVRGLPDGTTLRPDEIAPREFARRFKADPKGVQLIDVRSLEEWNASHVEGSIHVPLEQIDQRGDDLGLEGATIVGVLCHHGVRSLRATLALREMGHDNVFSVIGGIDLWSMAVDQKVPRYERNRVTGRCTIK
jgi:adenylyltransferase/sulfurtransferase